MPRHAHTPQPQNREILKDSSEQSQTCVYLFQRIRRIESMNASHLGVVLDTNVLISLLVFRDERFGVLAQAWEKGRLRVFSNEALRQELERVLHYPGFLAKRPPEQALALYDERVVQAEALDGGLPLCRDPDDQKFLLLAAGAGASVLVSDDKQLLRMRKKLAFQVETPLRFQRRLAEATADQ